MTTKNNRSINRFWYEMLERSIGAIYSVSQSVANVITGLPPLSICNNKNSIEHYVKTFQQSERRLPVQQNHEIEWLLRIKNRKRFERRCSLPGV